MLSTCSACWLNPFSFSCCTLCLPWEEAVLRRVGAAAVFGLFVPWNLAGVMAIAWRLISEYSGVALGTIVAIKLLGWGGAEKVMKEESERLKNAGK